MTFHGNWNKVLKAFASLLSENVSINLRGDRDDTEYSTMCVLVASFFPVFKITKLSPLRLFWKQNAFPFSSSFFFFQEKDPLHPLLPNVLFPLFHGLSLKKQWPVYLFLRALLTLKTLDWFLVQAQGQWLAVTWSLPCKSSLNGRWLKHSSPWTCKVSPVSQPIMIPSKAIAGPLMYFGPRPLLYLAKLWESTV